MAATLFHVGRGSSCSGRSCRHNIEKEIVLRDTHHPFSMARWSAAVLVVLAALAGVAAGGDIVHQDDEAPKIPGCSNDFMLVRPSFPPRFISS
jgi:hypothetical protein